RPSRPGHRPSRWACRRARRARGPPRSAPHWRPWARGSPSLVTDLDDREAPRARRRRHAHVGALALAEEGRADRRPPADALARGVDLVLADELELLLVAVVVFENHRGAEKDLVSALLRRVDDHRRVDALAQKAHAPIDLAELALAVDVLRVLRAVALR